jgi:uncharacterized protein YndB with AHSA1/START domain
MSQENLETVRHIFKTSLDVEIAVEIEQPHDEVWAFVSNAERLPEWLDEFEAVVKESEGPIGKGTVFRYTLSPGHRSATFEIVDWEPGHSLRWDGPPLPWRGGAGRPRGSFKVVATSTGHTRFVSRYQPELTGTMALMRPILRRWLRKQRTADTQRLKELLESGRDE